MRRSQSWGYTSIQNTLLTGLRPASWYFTEIRWSETCQCARNLPSVQHKASPPVCIQAYEKNYPKSHLIYNHSKPFQNEPMVSIASFKSSSIQHYVHLVNHSPLSSEIVNKASGHGYLGWDEACCWVLRHMQSGCPPLLSLLAPNIDGDRRNAKHEALKR